MKIREFLEKELADHQVEQLYWFHNLVFFWFADKNTEIDSDALRMIAGIELEGQKLTVNHVGFVGKIDNPKAYCNGCLGVECKVEEYTRRQRYWVFPNIRFIPRNDPLATDPTVYEN